MEMTHIRHMGGLGLRSTKASPARTTFPAPDLSHMNASNLSDPATLAALQQQQQAAAQQAAVQQAAAQQAQVASQQQPIPPVASHQPTQQQLQVLQNFWNEQVNEIQTGVFDFKVHQLPLARIKKVMKADEDVKVSSACL